MALLTTCDFHISLFDIADKLPLVTEEI